MSSETPEGRTLEVLDLPPGVDEELLTLYFENKRRSGGGPLVSVEKKGDARILVFEEAEGKWKHRPCCPSIIYKYRHTSIHPLLSSATLQ